MYMTSQEAFSKIASVFALSKDHHLKKREQELASIYFTKWWKSGEINWSTMMYELRGLAEQEGISVERTMSELSKFTNPTGSL